MGKRLQRVARVLAVCLLAASVAAVWGRPRHARATATPIDHVVVIVMENRTFDNVLGALCVERVASGDPAPCDGTREGLLSNGNTIPLTLAPDIQPPLNHSVNSHLKGLDWHDGVARMDGFERIQGCQADPGRGHAPYACFDQFDPQGDNAASIANITVLADQFTISDRTFESYTSASWSSHFEMVAGTRDLFHGDNPHYKRQFHPPPRGPGGGCDSHEDAAYDSPTQGLIYVPSCVPDRNGDGPYRDTPVSYVPTIFDRMDANGLSYKVYVKRLDSFHSPCSYFWECTGTSQRNHTVSRDYFTRDARDGTLPNVSLLIPSPDESQHPTYSMLAGDDWIGYVVGAVERSPDWNSTAIFLTYDDCGCFYDHVAPPTNGMGLRVPMVIISRYAKPHFVDHTTATLASTLAFIEHNWSLAPLGDGDRGAYDFHNAFDYAQTLVPAVRMVDTPLPQWEVRYLKQHPGQRQPS